MAWEAGRLRAARSCHDANTMLRLMAMSSIEPALVTTLPASALVKLYLQQEG